MYQIWRFLVHIMGDMYPKIGKWVHIIYIIYETIDISDKMASVRIGSVNGITLPIVDVRNILQLFSA